MTTIGFSAHVRSIPPGQADAGVTTRPILPLSAFGEVSVAEDVPVYQTDFVYPRTHGQLHRVTAQANGAVTYADNMAVCSSGSTAKGLAAITSTRPLKYRPGQGAIARFTALFSAPTAGSVQGVGLSNGEVGLLIGYYFSTSFGVWRQGGGRREVRTLTVGTGSTTAESVTVTLEGVAVTVAVTNSGSTTRTAWEIAQGDYGDVSDVGYDAFAEGAAVRFVRRQTGAVTGTFSLVGSSAVGTFAQTVEGVAPTATLVTQPNFSVDPLDGTGPSGMVIDPTKGNVFQITYQYLGFGEIIFWAEDPSSGLFFPFHEIDYANANTIPSLTNPSITWSMSAYNFVGADNAVTVKSASVYLATQGRRGFPTPAFSALSARTSLAAARVPVLSIRPSQLYAGRINMTEVIMRALSAAVSATKPVQVELVLNGTLNATANFQAVGGDSMVLRDVSATSITGGATKIAFTLGKDGQSLVNLASLGEISLTRFDTISVVLTPSAANTDADASLSWFEDV